MFSLKILEEFGDEDLGHPLDHKAFKRHGLVGHASDINVLLITGCHRNKGYLSLALEKTLQALVEAGPGFLGFGMVRRIIAGFQKCLYQREDKRGKLIIYRGLFFACNDLISSNSNNPSNPTHDSDDYG